jgi:hypothetical protein
MPIRSLDQSSFFDPEFVCPSCLEPGTVPWLLARCRSKLFPNWLLKGWRGESRRGRKAWPAVVLVSLWLLRWTEEGMSRLASIGRAKTDLRWRSAMGLACDVEPPSEKTMRDFERFLSQRHTEAGVPRYMLVHEQIVRLCKSAGVVGEKPLWATDSTPMWCYGAVLDTVRLLGDGLRQLGRRWARATRTSVVEVAELWDQPLLLAKSTKGAFDIDWRDPDARASVVDELAQHAINTVQWIRDHADEARRGLRKGLRRWCRRLLRVVQDDLETDEQGRLVIARRVARDRLVSLTDPQARHGRKSRRRLFNGFKLHLLGDLVSGLISALTVTAANVHDGKPTHRLIGRAKRLFDEIDEVLGDTAYGGSRLRHGVKQAHGVDLLTPPPSVVPPKDGRFAKADFAIDFESGAVTCPNGVVSTDFTLVNHSEYALRAQRYRWPKEACGACPLRTACLGKGRGSRWLLLNPFEEEIRAHRDAWQAPEVRACYRRRAEFERLVNRATRHGARQARAWGLRAANLQGHAIVATCNLQLLAKVLAAEQGKLEEFQAAA